MGMTNRIRDRTIAPPFVPGSRKTGRLLFSDIMFNADVDDDDFVLLPLSIKALLLAVVTKVVENCLALFADDWTLIADGANAAASWPNMMVAIAHAQMVNIDLAMVNILTVMQSIISSFCSSLDAFFNMEVKDLNHHVSAEIHKCIFNKFELLNFSPLSFAES